MSESERYKLMVEVETIAKRLPKSYTQVVLLVVAGAIGAESEQELADLLMPWANKQKAIIQEKKRRIIERN